MDSKIDPQLAFLAESVSDSSSENMAELVEHGFFGLEAVGKGAKAAKPDATMAQILVQAQCDADALRAAGMEVRSEIGDVFTGAIPLNKLEKLAKVDGVERIESAREMVNEMDLAIVDTRVNLVHSGPPGRRGAGVIVGVVDTGIDFTHPAFRNSDGSSRIQFIWDQRLTPRAGESSPAPFGYGVVYDNARINTALGQANPFATVRHEVGGGDHGTHVTGIAAGNGRGGNASQPEFRFMGVAPDADIIVVAVGGGGAEGMATSTNALDAVNWVYQRAAQLDRPCAVNMSLGDNLGPHDGTSLLERGLDNLLGGSGRGFVKSAGNVGNARHHAGGNITTNGTANVGFAQPNGNVTPSQLDFWYPGGSNFRAEVLDSAGNTTGEVAVGVAQTFTLAGGNTVRIDHRNNDPFNGDRRIFITITRGTSAQIRQGNWTLRLRSISSGGGGRFDGWIQRHNNFTQRPTFNAPFESNDRTISTPGTAREVVTAANYITRGAGLGSLAASSSRGPTRDGRAAPTLAAPGTNIMSASSRFGTGNPYIDMSGTSMAAPHITGVMALMLQKNRNRTQEELRNCLVSTARSDAFTGPVPNTAWGAGKVDAEAAVNCTPPLINVPPRSVLIACNQPSVVVRLCPSRIAALCQPSVVVSQCPSQLIACQPSVVNQCPSQLVACQPSVLTRCPSQLVACQPSVVSACASQLVSCPQPSQTTVCPQQTLLNCPQVTVQAACQQTVLTCPQQTAFGVCGGPITVPGRTIVVNPQIGAEGDEVPAGPPTAQGDIWDSQANLPETGYYEYDESWFDMDDGSGQP